MKHSIILLCLCLFSTLIHAEVKVKVLSGNTEGSCDEDDRLALRGKVYSLSALLTTMQHRVTDLAWNKAYSQTKIGKMLGPEVRSSALTDVARQAERYIGVLSSMKKQIDRPQTTEEFSDTLADVTITCDSKEVGPALTFKDMGSGRFILNYDHKFHKALVRDYKAFISVSASRLDYPKPESDEVVLYKILLENHVFAPPISDERLKRVPVSSYPVLLIEAKVNPSSFRVSLATRFKNKLPKLKLPKTLPTLRLKLSRPRDSGLEEQNPNLHGNSPIQGPASSSTHAQGPPIPAVGDSGSTRTQKRPVLRKPVPSIERRGTVGSGKRRLSDWY